VGSDFISVQIISLFISNVCCKICLLCHISWLPTHQVLNRLNSNSLKDFLITLPSVLFSIQHQCLRLADLFMGYLIEYLPEDDLEVDDGLGSCGQQLPRQHEQHGQHGQHGQGWAADVHWLLVVLEPKVIPKVLEWCKD
jgi:hypothetical protein